MVALSAVFDAAQYAHGRIGAQVVIELDRVEVLHGNPPEDGTSLLHVRHTAHRQLADEVGEGLLILTGDLSKGGAKNGYQLDLKGLTV